MESILSQHVSNITAKIVESRSRIILNAVRKAEGLAPTDDIPACFVLDTNRAALHVFPDGREVFLWDFKPLVEFYPPTFRMDGNTTKCEQNYKELA